MKQIGLNVLITLASVLMTVIVMHFVFHYWFVNLGKFTFTNFQKFLICRFTPIDFILAQYTPLFFIFPILKTKLNYRRQMLLATVIGIFSIFLSMIVAVIIGICTWENDKLEPLLPNYVVVQPFANYWTCFLALGIIVPIVLLMWKKKKPEINTID